MACLASKLLSRCEVAQPPEYFRSIPPFLLAVLFASCCSCFKDLVNKASDEEDEAKRISEAKDEAEAEAKWQTAAAEQAKREVEEVTMLMREASSLPTACLRWSCYS